MRKLIFLFLLISTVSYGQLKCCFSVPVPPTYVAIPSAPTLTTPTTIIPSQFCCSSPGLFNYTLVNGGSPLGGDVKTSGAFTAGFSARQFDGDATHIYRFVNTAGDVYGTQGAGQNHGVSTTNSGNYLYFYGLDAAHPMVVTGENGFQLPSATVASGGAHFILQNIVIRYPNASGFTGNFGISGTNYYENWNQSFTRVIGAGASQEGICYLGNTGASYNGVNIHNIGTVTHNFSYNTGREGIQAEHVNLFTASNNTIILPGQGGTAGQTNALQLHDLGTGSRVSYNVIDNAPNIWNIFTHGTRIDHNYFSFTAADLSPTRNGFIGRSDNAYFAATSTRMSGDSLIVENNYFNYTGGGTLAYLTAVEERVAHIIFRNNTFSSNITHIMLDNRVSSPTNTLTGDIGDHGNVSATITAPTYVTGYNDPDDYANQGLQSLTSVYLLLHFGYRSP